MKKKSLKLIRLQKKRNIIITCVLLIVVGVFIFKKTISQNSINLLTSSTYVPVTCGVKDIQLNRVCSENKFQKSNIVCADGNMISSDPGSPCYSVSEWYQLASTLCQNKCLASVAPSPSPSPLGSGCKQIQNQCAQPVCAKGAACVEVQPSCSTVVICETTTITKPVPSKSPAPSGCVYKDVRCIKEPCEPILVCSDQTGPISPAPLSSPTPPPMIQTNSL